MSTDFTVVLSATERSLFAVFADLVAGAAQMGFRCSGSVLRCQFETDSHTFDEVSPEESVSFTADPLHFEGVLTRWDGFAFELWNDAFMLYILVSKTPQAHLTSLNVWVTLSTRALQRLAIANNLENYYSALAMVAKATAATCGYGHFEIAYEPITPEQTEAAIMQLPDYPSEAATLALLPTNRWTLEQIQTTYGRDFEAPASSADYWMLVRKQLKHWLGAT